MSALQTKITLNKTSASITSGSAVTLTAKVTHPNSTAKIATPTITWSSSDTTIATVSSKGVVTAVGLDSATITASTSDITTAVTCIVTLIPVKNYTYIE